MKIADRLKLCREKLNLSQADIADLANVSQPSYQKIEKGLVKNPKNLEKLSEIFKTTPEWLQFGSGNSPDYLDDFFTPIGKIPLIPWELVYEWHNTYNIDHLSDKERISFVCNPFNRSHKIFALEIKDDSMVSSFLSERSFQIGDIIFVDPSCPYQIGDFIIACHSANKTIPFFGKYGFFAGTYYLLPSNPQYPSTPINDGIKFYGKVIGGLKILI